jgi:hypothetical protein
MRWASSHELCLSAPDLVKAVGSYTRGGGLDANARGSVRDGVSFSQPEESGANSIHRGQIGLTRPAAVARLFRTSVTTATVAASGIRLAAIRIGSNE